MFSDNNYALSISQSAISEFLSLCQVPHPCYKTAKMLAYLQGLAAELGYAHFRDDYGNFWMDIPATPGLEGRPKFILQAHMDMVCVAAFGRDIDFELSPIAARIDEEKRTITAEHTSLGADNGIGVAIILALAKSDIPHGPWRALITADEDVGLLGAKALDPAALDSNFLINVDNEKAGDICYSNMGALRFALKKGFSTSARRADECAFELSVAGLRGGHSGDDIGKNRLSAAVALREILSAWAKSSIPFRCGTLDIGAATNAIAPEGHVWLALPQNQVESAENIVGETVKRLAELYPEEKIAVTMILAEKEEFLTSEDSRELLEMLCAQVQGVISTREDGVAVRSSSNIGLVKLDKGQSSITCMSRSCVTEDLGELEERFSAQARSRGYAYEHISSYPGWNGSADCPIIGSLWRGFERDGRCAPALVAANGGLECSWFVQKRPGMQIASVGPTISGAHSVGETLYLDTIEPVVAAILSAMRDESLS